MKLAIFVILVVVLLQGSSARPWSMGPRLQNPFRINVVGLFRFIYRRGTVLYRWMFSIETPDPVANIKKKDLMDDVSEGLVQQLNITCKNESCSNISAKQLLKNSTALNNTTALIAVLKQQSKKKSVDMSRYNAWLHFYGKLDIVLLVTCLTLSLVYLFTGENVLKYLVKSEQRLPDQRLVNYAHDLEDNYRRRLRNRRTIRS